MLGNPCHKQFYQSDQPYFLINFIDLDKVIFDQLSNPLTMLYLKSRYWNCTNRRVLIGMYQNLFKFVLTTTIVLPNLIEQNRTYWASSHGLVVKAEDS